MGTHTLVTEKLDSAEAAGFSTQANLNDIAPGTTFQATWTFKNSGSTTWNGRYRFVYTLTPHSETAGFTVSPLGAQTAWTLEELGAPDVPPGATVQITLVLTAPNAPDTYATNWQLQTPEGERFGPIRWLRAVVTAVTPGDGAAELAYQMIAFENSVENFKDMQPGRQFAGLWTLRNSGTATWTGDFEIVYVDEVAVDTALSARSQMGAPAVAQLRDVAGTEQVKPGETAIVRLDLIAPTQPGPYAFHWRMRDTNGRFFGGLRWLQIGVSAPEPMEVTDEERPFQPGMNINPDVHGLDIDRLSGLSWVRFPFFAGRLKLSPEEAYQQRYRPIIQAYANAGIGSLLVLHQDLEWGNGPWDNGGWAEYAETFAQACGRVARVCAEFGDKVAYQVFNEQDCPPTNPSAIPIPSEHFALILDKAAAAIRTGHPGATVIIGGLNSGPDHAVQYVRDIQIRLNGRLPVDALAYHPYGRFVHTQVFNVFGPLSEVLDKFKAAFPDKPLWITEFGLPGHQTVIGPEHYAKIATHLREVTTAVTTEYDNYVQGLIWFAWTDRMENAGILTADGAEKEHIFDAFLEMKRLGEPATKAPDLLEEVSESVFVSYATTITNLNGVPASSQFTSRWTFKNSGSTTWGPGYKLFYVPKGDNPAAMTDKKSYAFADVAAKATVAPSQTVEFSLTMTAPETPGRTYRSHWELRDPQGNTFGFLYEEITVIPASTVGTSVRAAGMAFVKDQTVLDNTRFVAGTDFDKQWLVKNTGSRHWGDGFRLVFVEGDLQLARGKTTHLVPTAKPGDTVTLTVPMTAPPARGGMPTEYKTLWRMQDDRGDLFGDPIWAVIVSTTAVSPVTGGDTALARLLNDPTLWYSQRDTSWAADVLGTGQATIGSWGCLMTCMAMALSAYGTRITPKELNQRLIQLGSQAIVGSNVQFVAPFFIGNLKFNKNVKSWPNSDISAAVWTGEDPIQRIDNALAAGKIVVAQVDTKPNNGFYNNNNEQHWVVLVKRTPAADDYLMIDPLTPPEQVLTQPRSLMAKYGDPIPSRPHSENLRNAIKSTLVYDRADAAGG